MNGRRGRAVSVGTLLWTSASVLAGSAPADTLPVCPSFAALGRRVDDRVRAIKPGLTLKEFTSQVATQALNFWDNVGWQRETVFFVTVTEGNAQVSDEVVCRFDRNDRLVRCKRECCRGETRTITLDQYNSLAVGETRAVVEGRLCSPSDAEADPKNAKLVRTYYHIDLPVGHHDEGQTVLLVFENGTVSSKGMSPYY